MITFVVATVLAKQVHHSGIDIWINAGLRDVSPVMAVIGWLVWGPRPVLAFVVLGVLYGVERWLVSRSAGSRDTGSAALPGGAR